MGLGFFDGFKMGLDVLWSILTANLQFTFGIVLFFGGSFVLAIIVRVWKEARLRKSGILEVDQMPGRQFEEFLSALLKAKGYAVQLTPASGDYGADLILSSNRKRIVVQAKRYKKKVGIKAVQEIASAKSHYHADECWVITNNFFTEQAKRLAHSNSVRLFDREQLMHWMLVENRSAR